MRWLLAATIYAWSLLGYTNVSAPPLRTVTVSGTNDGLSFRTEPMIPGTRYTIWASCDLVSWTNVETFYFTTNLDLCGQVTLPCSGRAFFRVSQP